MKIAKYLLITTGIFPILVGLYQYIHFFSLVQINLIEHIAFTNLFAMGVVTVWLGVTAERKEMKRSRLLLGLFALFWTGGNDAFIVLRHIYSPMTKAYVFPFPLFPLTTGSIGLFFHAHALRLDLPRLSRFVKAVIIVAPFFIIGSAFYAIKMEKQNFASGFFKTNQAFLDKSINKCPNQIKRECCLDATCTKKSFCSPLPMECRGQKTSGFCYTLEWLGPKNSNVICQACDQTESFNSTLKRFVNCF